MSIKNDEMVLFTWKIRIGLLYNCFLLHNINIRHFNVAKYNVIERVLFWTFFLDPNHQKEAALLQLNNQIRPSN